MRIISQLVPNGKPVSTDIEAMRSPDSTMWEIPAWGQPLALGIYPLFVTQNRRLLPLGTAFCVSNLGVSITALHNVIDTVRRRWNDDFVRRMESPPASYKMHDVGMAVFHHHAPPNGPLSGNLCNIEYIEGACPTDVGYIFPQFQGGVPYLPLPISFTIPRIGSRVVCVGFSDSESPDGTLSVDDIRGGYRKLLDVYEHKLIAIEGRVKRIFTQRFTDGFIGGPCFTIDAEIKQGMNGGPVFSENGYVCGIISGGATDFFGEPASIISLFYPALMTTIRLDGQIGLIRINSNRRLMELIAQGAVITDGSENLVTISEESGKFIVHPSFHGEDADCIYDDFLSFREGRHVNRESKDVYGFSHEHFKKN